MKHKKMKISRFWKEFKRQIRLSVTAAIGFIIAFAWKDYIIDLANSTFSDLKIAFPNTSNFLTAFLLTFLGVVLIFMSSRMLE